MIRSKAAFGKEANIQTWNTIAVNFCLTVHKFTPFIKGKNVTDFRLMLAVFDEMQNDDIVAIASADTDYLTLIEFLKAKEKTVLGFAQYQPSLSPLLSKFYGTLCVVKNGCVYIVHPETRGDYRS
ncbi:NYN domain-containing protein [Sutterella sp. AM11-39]|nr:NYN domain-containing protein [Sutterella sp. AM11-39]